MYYFPNILENQYNKEQNCLFLLKAFVWRKQCLCDKLILFLNSFIAKIIFPNTVIQWVLANFFFLIEKISTKMIHIIWQKNNILAKLFGFSLDLVNANRELLYLDYVPFIHTFVRLQVVPAFHSALEKKEKKMNKEHKAFNLAFLSLLSPT